MYKLWYRRSTFSPGMFWDWRYLLSSSNLFKVFKIPPSTSDLFFCAVSGLFGSGAPSASSSQDYKNVPLFFLFFLSPMLGKLTSLSCCGVIWMVVLSRLYGLRIPDLLSFRSVRGVWCSLFLFILSVKVMVWKREKDNLGASFIDNFIFIINFVDQQKEKKKQVLFFSIFA